MTDDELALTLVMTLMIGAVLVVYYSGVELHNLSSGVSSRDPEVTPGSNIRRLFLFGLMAANISRIVGLVVEAVLFYIYHNHIVTSDDDIDDSVWTLMFISRLLPSLIYVSIYSLISVYFAQLCYTVSGLPFFHVRNFSVFGNFVAYLLVIIFATVAPIKFMLWWTMFCSYTAIFTTTMYYGYTLYIILPGSTAHHQFIAKRLMVRFLPLFIICATAGFCGVVYYFLLVAQFIPAPIGYPSIGLLFVDFGVYGITEICPSLAIVVVISKKAADLPSSTVASMTASGSTGGGGLLPSSLSSSPQQPSSSSSLLQYIPQLPQIVNNFISRRKYESIPGDAATPLPSSSSSKGPRSSSSSSGSLHGGAAPPLLAPRKSGDGPGGLGTLPGQVLGDAGGGRAGGGHQTVVAARPVPGTLPRPPDFV